MFSPLSKSDSASARASSVSADTGGAKEDEGTEGMLRVLAAGTGVDDGGGSGLNRFGLGEDALVDNLIETQELFLLTFEETRNGAVVLMSMTSWRRASPAFA